MKDYPVIKFTIVFCCGILVSKFVFVSPLICIISVVCLILISIFTVKISSKITSESAATLSLAAAILFTGIFISEMSMPRFNSFPYDIYKIKNITFSGKITDVELKRNGAIVFELKCDSSLYKNIKINTGAVLLCKVRDDNKRKSDSLYNLLTPGNEISMRGTYSRGRGERNPGEFDYGKYLRSEGITGTFTTYDARNVKILKDDRNFLANLIFNIRKSLDARISSLHTAQTAALLRGLLLADRSEIDYETRTEFVNSGVVHVLAVSGLHVGFIIMIFLFLFGRFNIYWRSFLTAAGLIIFMLITGMPASVFRATVMAVVLIIAFISNRSTNLINSLATAALIILAVRPSDLFSPGFQLSFSAVLSIAVIYPVLKNVIAEAGVKNKPVKNLLLFAGLTLSAQIGSLPFTLTYFGKLSVIGIAANLIVIPLIGCIVGIAFATLFFSIISTALASYYAAANDLLTEVLYKFVNFSGGFNFSFLRITGFSAADAMIYFFFLSLAVFFISKFHSLFGKIILTVLTLLNILVFTSINDDELLPSNKLSVMMIDVGQGDSFLIKFPDGSTALVDAGNATEYFDNGERIVKPLMEYLGIDKIDYGFVSHIDADHYGGFVSLIHDGLIGRIYKPLPDTSLLKDIKFEDYLTANNVPVSYYSRKKISIGNANVYVLNDTSKTNGVIYSSNNNSGVFKLVYGKTSMLFTGDLERKGEKIYLSEAEKFLDSDVLKVAHHGSMTGSSKEFLSAVSPRIGLISAGILNRFGHPAESVITALKNAGAKIFRTDLSGAVLLVSNGNSFKICDWK